MTTRILLILLLSSPILASEQRPKNAWSIVEKPIKGKTQTFGGYSNGCFVGGATLPHTGKGYETIRRHRNRFYGHPELIEVVKWIAAKHEDQGGERLLIGDLSQPAGGPMPYGHRSHQAGLDADIWFTNVDPSLRDSDESFPRLVDLKKETINPDVWDPKFVSLLKLAGSHPSVDRIFVNWILKRHLCQTEQGDKSWLRKLRPWWGHDRHFHVRLRCPTDSPRCRPQASIASRPPCGGETWFSDAEVLARRKRSKKKTGPKKPKVLPNACKRLLKQH